MSAAFRTAFAPNAVDVMMSLTSTFEAVVVVLDALLALLPCAAAALPLLPFFAASFTLNEALTVCCTASCMMLQATCKLLTLKT